MKEVIYNENNLTDELINRTIRRAKAVIENNKGEILLASSYNNYQLPGGHIEKYESFADGLIRELFEETGIKIDYKIPIPFITIFYYTKNSPIENINTKHIGNYYIIKTNTYPQMNNLELTNEEKMGNFKLEFVNKNNIISTLEENLKTCTHKDTVMDTLVVLQEYLKQNT